MIYTHISHGLFDSSFEDGSVAHAHSPPGSLSDAPRRGRHGYIACRTTAINTLRRAVVYAYDLRGRKTYEGGATYPVRSVYDVFGNRTAMATYRDEAKGPDSGDVLCASNVRVIRK